MIQLCAKQMMNVFTNMLRVLAVAAVLIVAYLCIVVSGTMMHVSLQAMPPSGLVGLLVGMGLFVFVGVLIPSFARDF